MNVCLGKEFGLIERQAERCKKDVGISFDEVQKPH
jgi:hypothetical protein